MHKQKLGLGLKQQKGTGVLDKPLEVVKCAETLTKKMLSQDQLVSQARNFGLIQKKVLSCVW